MSHHLEMQDAVLAAIRRFLEASAGKDGKDAVRSLSEVTSRLPLGNFDIWEHLIRVELRHSHKEAPGLRWRFWTAADRAPSWLDLCSPDGFVREKCLRSLQDAAPDGFLFSLALRRLNDWVPQVRMAARETIPSIAAGSQPQIVAEALWSALPHFTSWGRMRDEDRQVFLSLIAVGQVAASLKSRIIGSTSGPSTKVLAHAGRTAALDPWLDEIAGNSIQPSTRAKAYRSLLEQRTTWPVGRKWVWTDLKWCKGIYEPLFEERRITVSRPLKGTLKAAVADRSPTVRRVGAELLIRNIDSLGPDVRALAEALASDPSHYVSERGKFALAKLDGSAEDIDGSHLP